jgi:signal transduction histidine kinase
MPAIEQKLKLSEKRIALLQKGYQAVLEFTDKMEQLSQFQDKIDIPSNISQIWRVFLDDIRNSIKVEVCGLFLVDENTHEFVLTNASPEDKGPICQKEIDYQIECGMFSWIINRRQPALIPSFAFKDKKTIVMLPLSTVKRTLGVALVLTPIEESSITQESLKLLTMLAKQCSLVMENTLLFEHLRKEHETLKKAQAQIVQAEKLASIGRLAAGASHEILNPLNIISGHIQLLLMHKDLNPRFMRNLDIMRDQSDRIGKIVKGLLQFSHHPKPRIREVKLRNLIEMVLSMFEHEARFHNIEIIKEIDPNLPSIMGDDERLSQVLFNLLSNSINAMPKGGTLRISAKTAANEGQLSGKSGFIEIRFQDTGCGIAEENIDKIFDPFFTLKEDRNGIGLGLSLSYGIVREHGGTISVESKVNEGTSFTIYLPIARQK